jgi:hypothetical protein
MCGSRGGRDMPAMDEAERGPVIGGRPVRSANNMQHLPLRPLSARSWYCQYLVPKCMLLPLQDGPPEGGLDCTPASFAKRSHHVRVRCRRARAALLRCLAAHLHVTTTLAARCTARSHTTHALLTMAPTTALAAGGMRCKTQAQARDMRQEVELTALSSLQWSRVCCRLRHGNQREMCATMNTM